jgi:allantoin racemase
MTAILHVIPVRTRPGRLARERERLAVLVAGIDVHVIDLPDGPRDLEYFVDDHEAVGQMLRVVPPYVADHDIGAVSIGCFYDPGLWELRETLSVPVVGIGEASVLLAGPLASRLAVLVGGWKWVPKMAENLRALGLAHRVCAWRSVDRSVQAMQDDPEDSYGAVRRAALAARDDDHAEAVILGCGALAGMADRLQQELGIPAIDPAAAGVALAAALASLGLQTSKAGGYRPRA